MSSPYADYGFYLAQYTDKTTSISVATGDSATVENTPTVKSANHTLYIQRIMQSVFTNHATATVTFQDDAGTPVKIATSAVNPGTGVDVVADFGPKGFALTQGKNLDMIINASGLGCVFTIEAYEKLTAVIAHTAANQ